MAKTKVYKSNSWEQAGAALNPSAGRSVGNVSVAAGWHSENIVTLDKGKYIIQVQFTFNTTEAATVCLTLGKGADTGAIVYARETIYAPAGESGVGKNMTALINENDFDGEDTKEWRLMLWNNKTITRTAKSFVVTKLD